MTASTVAQYLVAMNTNLIETFSDAVITVNSTRVCVSFPLRNDPVACSFRNGLRKEDLLRRSGHSSN